MYMYGAFEQAFMYAQSTYTKKIFKKIVVEFSMPYLEMTHH